MLPMFMLYGISDFLFFILWYVIPYRKKVVMQNLQRSFPDKTHSECLVVAKNFYRHFADVMVETLKGFSASKAWLRTKVSAYNTDLLDKYYAEGRSIIAVTAHYANWEWGALTFSEHTKHRPYGIYAPLNNKFWDNVLINSRKKFGTTLIPVKEVGQVFSTNINELGIYGFIADQAPSNVKRCHWMQFLNQDTPVFFGPEKYAKQFDYVVVYAHIDKLKRGHYSVSYSLISDTPFEENNTIITERHAHFLEKQIIAKPHLWLWTHKRWKRKRAQD